MKKITVLFTMLSVCFMFVIWQASTADEFVLGGVILFMSKDVVKNIYGEPKQVDDKHNRDICMYGDSFVLHFDDGYVTSMEIDDNNGIIMPAGFSVGSDSREVVKYFGQNYGMRPDYRSYDDMDCADFIYFYPNKSAVILRVGYDCDDYKICYIRIQASGIGI